MDLPLIQMQDLGYVITVKDPIEKIRDLTKDYNRHELLLSLLIRFDMKLMYIDTIS